MSVKILKLVTGEDVIARVEVAEDVYTIEKGFRLGITQQGLMMAPLCPFSKDNILTISEDKIVFITDPDSEIETEYKNQTSDIITASGPTIALA
jgi:hypothetical protein